MTVFELRGKERKVMNAAYWLVSASVAGKKVECNGDVRSFILKLEEMNARPYVWDLEWLNRLCQVAFGRNYMPKMAVEAEKRELERKAMEESGIIKNIDRTKNKR